MRSYELLLVIRSTSDDTSAVEVAQTVEARIKDLQGNVTSTNVWGRRRLAYPINKQSEGTYILLKFQAPPASLKDLDFDLKLNESVLRYLLVIDGNPDVVTLQEEATEAEEAVPEAEPAEESSTEATASIETAETAASADDAAEDGAAPADAAEPTSAEAESASEVEGEDSQEIVEEVA